MAHHQPGCAIPQDFRYYMLRGNDIMVPMVPADQLPFTLPGVPRQLTHQQMSSECWKYLPEPASAFSVPPVAPSIPIPSPPAAWAKPQFRAPDHQVRNDQYVTDEPVARPKRWSHSPTVSIDVPSTHRKAHIGTPEKALSLTDKLAELYPLEAQRCGYQMRNPSGIEPDSSRKEFCTHWLRTGECDFTAVGCKYKHEMPDIVKLRELGFTLGLPRWWKDKLATTARGPTWIEQRRAAQGNHEDMDLDEIPARREFDPSVFKRRSDTEQDTPSDYARQRRSLLRRETGCERTVHSLPAIPLTPLRRAIRPASPMPNLLIDLDDAPAPPPSPQLSTTSSASTGSDGTMVSDRTSDSPSASLTMKPIPISPTDNKPTHRQPKAQQDQQPAFRKPRSRRDSELSWDSAMSDEIKRSLPATPAPLKPQRDQKPAASRSCKQSFSGLANSRHAPSATRPHSHHGTHNRDAPGSQPQPQPQHQHQHQHQQQCHHHKPANPLKPRPKPSKARDRARNHLALLKDRVPGTVAKTSAGPVRKATV